ncbi:hypothetical protein CRUP_023334 [Coryphaenoides rupestris]|nr:hypothetical protein CRUP_023334 [Coryphaenoides rupestris]
MWFWSGSGPGCDMCADNRNGECPMHGPLHSLRRLGTWLGPYQGVPLLLDKLQSGSARNTRHLWEIYDGDGSLQHFVDGNEPTKSSWMRYIRCARHCGEQNLMVVQYSASLRMRTTFNKNGKPSSSSSPLLRSMVFPHSPCSRSFSLVDKAGGPQADSAYGPLGSKNQRVLASPTSTSQLSSEFSDWHLWNGHQQSVVSVGGGGGEGRGR